MSFQKCRECKRERPIADYDRVPRGGVRKSCRDCLVGYTHWILNIINNNNLQARLRDRRRAAAQRLPLRELPGNISVSEVREILCKVGIALTIYLKAINIRNQILTIEQPLNEPTAFTTQRLQWKPLELGEIDILCGFCGAAHWLAERILSSSKTQPIFESCCKKGDVCLPRCEGGSPH